MNHATTKCSIPVLLPRVASNHRNDEEAVSFAWQLLDQDVKCLPEIYPRINNPVLLNNIPVDVIAKRLSRFMRINSVLCKYDTEHARVMGCTSQVSFVVQIWRARQPSIHQKNKILVEVTRRQGCCIVMHKLRHALAQSLQSDQDPVRYESLLRACHQLKPSPHIKSFCKSLSARFPGWQKISPISFQNKDLESSVDLLESKLYHEQDLGMEIIAYISDDSKVSKPEATTTANLLIFRQASLSGELSNIGSRLQNAVEDYVYDLQEVRPRLSDEGPFRHTLTALSNSLELLLLRENNSDVISSWLRDPQPMLFVYWRHMLHFFFKRLGAFREYPQSAAIAAKCIRLLYMLVVHSSEGMDEIQAHFETLPPLLQDACKYGRSFNELLEIEASELRQIMDGYVNK
ncbi:hypothetical protein IV203_033092 [Nitzschia inconspicua]|uniref:Uncharacterized protein n=1 Tax=Nitzschia inconspicua TaxID=303405 RepID=A0A9K3KLH8_9STRA|nr:hypothetical protein IV203_033092 [Nitzschia inconspicua]